ncbi:MAG: Swt1 family HEPN domain-containing protein [Syntrophobacteraceae bacterium]
MPWSGAQNRRLRRLFLEGFLAMDIAEPLVSFDAHADARTVHDFMVRKDFDLVGIRQDGLVNGFVKREDLLSGGICDAHFRPFNPSEVCVPETANLIDVVQSLAINTRCFVVILDRVGAIITLSDLEKAPMRMFLFGMITMAEMMMTEILRHRYGDGSWQALISEQRLAKAEQLREERSRRGQTVDLVDCLQFRDKGWILSYDEDIRMAFGQESRRSMRKAIRELETLRNNLAHTQAIIPDGWQRIVIACNRFDRNLETLADQWPLPKQPNEQG